MTTFQATLAVVIIFQVFSVATTVSRLANRYANKVRNADNGLWHDDAFAALAACGGLYVLGTLVAIACHAPVLNLLEYQLALFGYYFIVWSSRACLVMTTGRMLYHTIHRRPSTILLFRSLACLFVSVGVAFIILAAFLCVDVMNCLKDGLCICRLKTGLVLSALITGLVADTVMVGVNWYIFSLKSFQFKLRRGRRPMIYMGLSGGIFTLVADVIFWTSYKTSAPDKPLHLLSLTSAVVIVSGVSLNIPAVIGFVSKWLDLYGDPREVPNIHNPRDDVDVSLPQEGIALQILSLAASETTLTNLNAKQDQDSPEKTIVVAERDYDVWKVVFDA